MSLTKESFKHHYDRWKAAWESADKDQLETQISNMVASLDGYRAGIQALNDLLEKKKNGPIE